MSSGPEPARLRVLVAADGSEAANRAAAAVAGLAPRGSVEAMVVTVLSFELDPYTLLGEELPDTPHRVHVVERSVERAVEEPRRLLEQEGHRVTVDHRFGNAADEILAVIEEWRPDLVTIGRRGLGGAARWLIGSVSERVLRHAGVPVLIVP